jgi:hypothetical protein
MLALFYFVGNIAHNWWCFSPKSYTVAPESLGSPFFYGLFKVLAISPVLGKNLEKTRLPDNL